MLLRYERVLITGLQLSDVGLYLFDEPHDSVKHVHTASVIQHSVHSIMLPGLSAPLQPH
jgi:hypothetical protein